MNIRYKVLLVGIIIVILFLIFLNLPAIHKSLRCDEEGYVSIAGDCILNYDLASILIGMIQERLDYHYGELITCETGYELPFKYTDELPVCIKSETKEKP